MAVAALNYVYCTEADIEALVSVDGKVGRVDDDNTGLPLTGTETGYITSAIKWATARVNFFCLGHYAAIDLSTSYLVNQWAIVIAAHWLSIRRGNPAPGSWKELYEETIEDLKLVKSATYQIPDIGYRSAAFPAWSNMSVDVAQPLRRARVQRALSEQGANPPYRQSRDLGADYVFDP